MNFYCLFCPAPKKQYLYHLSLYFYDDFNSFRQSALSKLYSIKSIELYRIHLIPVFIWNRSQWPRLTELLATEAGEASVDGPEKGFHVWPIGSSQFTVSLCCTVGPSWLCYRSLANWVGRAKWPRSAGLITRLTCSPGLYLLPFWCL